MTARSYLVCDYRGCGREWIDTAIEPWVVRLRAREAGWDCIDDIDICPAHTNEESE